MCLGQLLQPFDVSLVAVASLSDVVAVQGSVEWTSCCDGARPRSVVVAWVVFVVGLLCFCYNREWLGRIGLVTL